ncbi:MAG TPA: hypothetical protein VFS46_06865 [Nitrososphaera sp.]|nr:hypothetical protein [Nitrososphaera sp.]
MLILVLPLSAYAESFTVITNKDIYTLDETARIVGVIPEDAPEGYAILIKVTGSGGDCATQNMLPAADNSFVSRPVRLDECGFGVFTVSAFYAELQANSTFTISNSSQSDAASRLELRMLKNVLLQAQDAVNARVRELVENGYVLSEEVAGKYSEGVSEASLALQAIEFGDQAEAKKHMIFAIRDFREVLSALSEEHVARFEQTAEQQAENDDNSDVVGTYRIMREYYYRLEDLAQKNQVDKDGQFDAAARLLASARQMIDEGNFETAELNLERVSMLLEAIRVDLLEEGEEQFVSYANSTSPEDEESARKLISAADRFENDALELLNKTGSDAEAQAKVQEALSFIADAKMSIEAQDLDSARDTLTAAYWAIEDAKSLIEDNNASSSNSGKNPDGSGESSGNGNSGKEDGDNDKGNEGSGNGSNDGKDDQ